MKKVMGLCLSFVLYALALPASSQEPPPCEDCGPWGKVFESGYEHAFHVNCCEWSQEDADAECAADNRLLPSAIVCDDEGILPGFDSDYRECRKLHVNVQCDWPENPGSFAVWCCAPPAP